MSSPYTRLRTEEEELMYDAGRMDMRDEIIKLLEADTCTDWTFDCCNGWCAAYKGAIDIIKKETK